MTKLLLFTGEKRHVHDVHDFFNFSESQAKSHFEIFFFFIFKNFQFDHDKPSSLEQLQSLDLEKAILTSLDIFQLKVLRRVNQKDLFV